LIRDDAGEVTRTRCLSSAPEPEADHPMTCARGIRHLSTRARSEPIGAQGRGPLLETASGFQAHEPAAPPRDGDGATGRLDGHGEKIGQEVRQE
jgi:hypothetical protein